ncbi:PucR family transcriptional regulator [Nonomuraea soli]|uniref:PucR family transcriptional regulator n=1 Tax=Nonomuraea soli TaxID=1032476 RepID=A0A7W0CKI0_9ACTN|nr:helix-turn-helix domain-containing protein [Nonomuraea soli]MBA2892866.1 hypothetical protein [Nonomuraea soli]
MPDLYSRMAPRVRELTAEVVARCAAEVPFYRELPRETLDGEVTRSVAAVFGLLLRSLRDPGILGPGELTRIIEWSARRAEERLPLPAAMTAYLIGAEVWWRALCATATPDELADAGSGLLGCLRAAVPAVALAHDQAAEDVRGEERRVRRALVSALFAGQPYQALAEAARIEVAPAYDVVVYAFEGGPRARLVQSALDAHAGTLVLADPDEGVALLPDRGTPELGCLAGRLIGDVGPVLLAAARATDPAGIPGALEEARRVMEIVQRLGRPPGLYRFDDVLLEYQLARPGAGLDRLAAKLDPLAAHPHLVDTLRAFVNRGHNRRQTSLDLHIHRNTLDYRLQRVSLLTGLDLGVPAQARLLEAALTARDLL